MSKSPLLTIGMATIDDFDGVYFTVTSLMIHHRAVMGDCEIVVVDNRPESKHGHVVRDWVRTNVPNGRYIAFDGPAGTAQSRNEVFRGARGQAVLCMDCHVLVVPGAVRKLMNYYLAHPRCRNLLTGPLLTDSGDVAATHQEPQWSKGAWGVWSIDERGYNPRGAPFEIWQQGMGLFSCRKDAWVGFHPEFRGFGGCESYVMEKFRQSGARVLCCPWLRWTHRFSRPHAAPYRISKEDRVRNYVVGFQELGLDTKPVLKHFHATHHEPPGPIRSDMPAERSLTFAVVGSRAYGGVNMRGRVLARHLSCELIEPRAVDQLSKRSTIIAIKSIARPETIRAKCERFVYDPLDAFIDSSPRTRPADYWRSAFQRLRFDEIIATSPACYAVMRKALPKAVKVHMIPHQCDRKIAPAWRNPDGPIVYSGLPCFIESGLSRIKQACRKIGKEFKMGASCDVLKGASLALALRLPPYNTELNRRCKPQIKLENAAAARLPVVSTDCPAALTLHPNVQIVPARFSVAELADAMQQALEGPGLSKAFGDDEYLAEMDRILGRPGSGLVDKPLVANHPLVVYTAIFGGYDQLHEPTEAAPGIDYICFTDNPRLRSKIWRVCYCPPTGDPSLQAKRYKILAHEVLDCKSSLWIDGSIELRGLNKTVLRMRADMALVPHVERNCIYIEANHCKRMRRGDPRRIDHAVARYKADGHPEHFGLWCGGIIWRRHTAAIRAFNEQWWGEVVFGTSRDQISLPVVLRRARLRADTLSDDVLRWRIHDHIR